MDTPALQVHRTPGRLRVRSLQLKQNPSRALHARSQLSRATGVRSVHLNSLTGSLLIHFDPLANTPEKLLQTAFRSDHPQVSCECPQSASGVPPLHSRVTRKAARVACSYAGEKLLEAALGLLIAAVL